MKIKMIIILCLALMACEDPAEIAERQRAHQLRLVESIEELI